MSCEGENRHRLGSKGGPNKMRKLTMSLLLSVLMVVLVVLACGKNTSSAPTEEELDDANHSAWCNQIYHQNISCRLYGKVEIPAEVLAKQMGEHSDWCKSINHKSVSCPGYGGIGE